MDEIIFAGNVLHAGNMGLGWRLCDMQIWLRAAATNVNKLGGKLFGAGDW